MTHWVFGSHLIYLLHWFFGREVSVRGRGVSMFSSDVEDKFDGEIRFESGISVQIDVSWSEKNYTKPETSLTIRV